MCTDVFGDLSGSTSLPLARTRNLKLHGSSRKRLETKVHFQWRGTANIGDSFHSGSVQSYHMSLAIWMWCLWLLPTPTINWGLKCLFRDSVKHVKSRERLVLNPEMPHNFLFSWFLKNSYRPGATQMCHLHCPKYTVAGISKFYFKKQWPGDSSIASLSFINCHLCVCLAPTLSWQRPIHIYLDSYAGKHTVHSNTDTQTHSNTLIHIPSRGKLENSNQSTFPCPVALQPKPSPSALRHSLGKCVISSQTGWVCMTLSKSFPFALVLCVVNISTWGLI